MPLMPGHRAQPDGDGDRLFVVEEQRRQLRPGAEPVVAGRAAHRIHRVVEAAQPLDVGADGARADAEPVGEFGRRPGRTHLQQPQDAEQSRGGVGHAKSLPRSRII